MGSGFLLQRVEGIMKLNGNCYYMWKILIGWKIPEKFYLGGLFMRQTWFITDIGGTFSGSWDSLLHFKQ
jgi:hypothetical protein